MPHISQRSEQVPLSPFRKLIPLADKAKGNGTRVYHLNIGQPDIATPPGAIAKLQQTPFKIIEYSPAVGFSTYRSALLDYYARFNISLSASDITVTTGGSEAILFFMLACLDPGDEIIIPEPFYANYSGFAHMAGIKIIPVTSYIEDGFALPPMKDFISKISPKTKAVLITNPNNPTGCSYSAKELNGLARLVKKHDLFLCVDEVYREFCYSPHVFTPALNLPDLEKNTIVIDSVSKRYSACGLRIGTLVTRNKAVTEIVGRYSKLRLSPPGLGQVLAEYLLQDDTKYLDTVKKEYENRRNIVYHRLKKMKGVTVYLPGGAFYCFARFPVKSAEAFCRWLLTDFEHKGATIMLSPGQGFYATPGLGEQEVRIAFVLNERDLEAAMDCLEAALSVYKDETVY